MTSVTLPELDSLARQLVGERHDAFSQRALARAYEEYVSRHHQGVAPVVVSADGTEYPTFYALLADSKASIATLEVRPEPAPSANDWGFLRPFQRLVLRSDGSADLHPVVPGPPERGIARFLLREHYLPRSRDDEDRGASGGSRVELESYFGTLDRGLGVYRERGLLPFSVAILVYLPEERARYEFDLLETSLLPDPRSGRLPPVRRARRTARFSFAVDRVIGRGDFSLLGARCLEVLSESGGLTSVELAHVFGGVRELVDSALQGLVARNLVTYDRRTGVYRPRIEAFVPSGAENAPSTASSATRSDAMLRTSVQELIAAADARASCPLCGAPLPPGPRNILCENCSAKVNAPA
ncbi:MAG TPA: hypothetical protein VEH28_08195 [Thermoplasmata archaeon]|nr:hypothetical protein [Thermoplasmata archaeon]